MLRYLIIPFLLYLAYLDYKHYSLPAWTVYLLAGIVILHLNVFAALVILVRGMEEIFHRSLGGFRPIPVADTLGIALLFSFFNFDYAFFCLLVTILLTFRFKKIPYFVLVTAFYLLGILIFK